MADQLGGASGNATAADLLTGYTASVATGPISGTMPNQGTPTLQPGQSIPAGYYGGGSVAQSTVKVQTGTTTASSGTNSFTLYGGTQTTSYYATVPVPSGAKQIIAVVLLSKDFAYGSNGAALNVTASPSGYADCVNATSVCYATLMEFGGQSYYQSFLNDSPLVITTSSITLPIGQAVTVSIALDYLVYYL